MSAMDRNQQVSILINFGWLEKRIVELVRRGVYVTVEIGNTNRAQRETKNARELRKKWQRVDIYNYLDYVEEEPC